MEKFIPYEKLSKKEKRKINRARRQTWGELNPVTRKPENSNRKFFLQSIPHDAILIMQAWPDIILGDKLFEKQHLRDCSNPFLISI